MPRGYRGDDRTYEDSVADLKRMCSALKSVGVKPIPMLWKIASNCVSGILQSLGYFDDPTYCEIVLFDGETLGIAAGAIEPGGHVTLGLGDYHDPGLGQPTSGRLVAFVAQMARPRDARAPWSPRRATY